MKVLVACEYSGIVRDAFTAAGHYAMSADLEPSMSPGNHYQGDVFNIIDLEKWDLLIAHPPCTYLCKAQLFLCVPGSLRYQNQLDAVAFVRRLLSVNIEKIAVENPIGILSTVLRKPNQIVYPWQFGDPYRKDICLWTKNLPPLLPTTLSPGRKSVSNHVNSRMSPALKSKIKSRFFKGVAEAMASQWS